MACPILSILRGVEDPELERDYETYGTLLDLWARENSIKTTKLQVLLAVNALLVSVVSLSGGTWYLYLAGAVFCFIWTFSIGRTSLFQDVWQMKIAALRARHPDDGRFSVLETTAERRRVSGLPRAFGSIPSKWYLLVSPLVFGIVWLVVLTAALVE
jgi:hypothetical protein